MKNLLHLLARISVLIMGLVSLTSCVGPGGPAYQSFGTGVSGGAVVDDGWGYDDGGWGGGGGGYAPAGYYAAPSYYGGFGGGYVGSGWGRGYAVCRSCGHNPCSCNRSLSRYSSPTVRINGHEHKRTDSFRLIGGRASDKGNKPDGYHSLDWYKSRGYDLRDYKKVQARDGHTHSVRNASSSNSHRGHNHKDDRRKR